MKKAREVAKEFITVLQNDGPHTTKQLIDDLEIKILRHSEEFRDEIIKALPTNGPECPKSDSGKHEWIKSQGFQVCGECGETKDS